MADGLLLTLPGRSLQSVAPSLMGPKHGRGRQFSRRPGLREGAGTVPVRYVYPALHFCCYYIVIYDEIITQLACYSPQGSDTCLRVTDLLRALGSQTSLLRITGIRSCSLPSSLAQPLLGHRASGLSLTRSAPPRTLAGLVHSRALAPGEPPTVAELRRGRAQAAVQATGACKYR